MECNKQMIGQWCKESVLGRGGFGVVTQWKDLNTGEKIALKLIRTSNERNKSLQYREKLLMEIDNIKRLSHKNIVKILKLPDEMSDKLSDNIVVICMEYCSGGDLRKVLNQAENCCGLPERTIRSVLKDVKNGIAYLHELDIIHGDIKPENIVLQSTNEIVYKLIDLGHQRELDQNKLYSSYIGTLHYIAPEVLAQSYSLSVDYWSLGVVCHEIITGCRPFPSDIPPLKWASLIKSKDFEDISITKNSEGNMEFNKHLPSELHLSQFLKDEFEYWLRLSLEWDGKIRGKNINSETVIFSVLDSILDKKIITVFTTLTLEQLSYEVDNSTAISTLKGWIQRDSKHSIDDQLLLLPTGETLSEECLAWKCWDPTNEVAMAYVFSKNGFNIPSEDLKIPPLINKMMEEPKRLYSYYLIKNLWRQAVYFVQYQLYQCSTFLEALAVKLLSLLKNIEELTSLDTAVTSEIQQAIGKMKLCNDSMNYNEINFKKFCQNDEKHIVTGWKKKSKILHENLSQIYAIAKTMSQKVIDVKFNFEKAQVLHEQNLEYEQQLKKILEACYKLYQSLHFMPKELRESESNSIEMVALVGKALEVRNNFMRNKEMDNNLKFLCNCEYNISCLKLPLEEFNTSVKELSKDIDKFHCGMLQDIWDTDKTK